MNILYRALPLEEFDKAKPLFEKLFPGLAYPSPETASVVVAEVEDKVIGFWFIQLCAHGEPAGIDPEYTNTVSMHKLLETLHQTLASSGGTGMIYYVHTATPEWGEALQAAGFIPLGYIYSNAIPAEIETE